MKSQDLILPNTIDFIQTYSKNGLYNGIMNEAMQDRTPKNQTGFYDLIPLEQIPEKVFQIMANYTWARSSELEGNDDCSESIMWDIRDNYYNKAWKYLKKSNCVVIKA